ncbi:MAG TPA: selenide, water dikinase SelD [Candidatus Deferrimicrobiaceae bacterium]
MGQGDLARILSAVPPADDPRLLVGNAQADDAAVFRLSDDLALVSTLDFFTPIVDDPYTYGAIAAANSLSDIYAMGGEPLYALAIAAFPGDKKTFPLLADVMAGAADKAREAGICIAGGHTVRDAEPKFGLAVTGRIHPQAVWRNSGAKAGDAMVLTKPLGTGIVTTCIKWGIASQAVADAAVRSMLRLNAAAGKAGREAGIDTATDITGYGLLGHLVEVLEASGLRAEIDLRSVPVLPGVPELLPTRTLPRISGRRFPGADYLHRRFGFRPIPGGVREMLAGFGGKVRFSERVAEETQFLLADPQTSGGLLMFVPEERSDLLLSTLAELGETGWRIGRTMPRSPGDPTLVSVT